MGGKKEMYQNTVFMLTHVVSRQTYQGWSMPPKEESRMILDHELVFVSKGVGEVMIEDTLYHLKENTLVYFPPNVSHKIDTKKNPPMHFYGVHFSFEDNTTPLRLPFCVDLTTAPHIGLLFKNLHRVYQQKDVLYQWRCSVQLQECLFAIFEHQFIVQGTQNHEKIKALLHYIHQRPYASFTITELCNYSGLQKTALTQHFREVTGTTPLQYCVSLKIAYAKELLLSQFDLSIIQIAYSCGFEDPLYFSRCFKQHVGVSPRGFRKQHE